MQADLILIRFIFVAILVVAGFLLHPVPGPRYVSALAGAIIAGAIILFEMRIQRASLKTLIGAAFGSLLGIIGAYLIGSLVSSMESPAVSPPPRPSLLPVLSFPLATFGLFAAAAKADSLNFPALVASFST